MKVYKTLYSINNIDDHEVQEYLDKIKCEEINNEKKMCVELLTLEGCKLAIEDMKNNQSSGQNGVPGEFYNVFWHVF